MSSFAQMSEESQALLSEPSKVKVQEILDFWFGRRDDPDFGKTRALWYRSSKEFDDEIRDKFGPLIDAAVAGELEVLFTFTYM